MSAHASCHTLASELRDVHAAVIDRWQQRFRCPVCRRPCRPDLVRDAFSREWRMQMRCRDCGYTGEGKLGREWPEVAS